MQSVGFARQSIGEFVSNHNLFCSTAQCAAKPTIDSISLLSVPPSTHTGDKRTIAHLHRMSTQNVFNHEKMCTKCIAVCANVHMLVKVNVYSCENVHRCVHIGKCPQLCTLRGTVPRYICHRVSIRANFRIFPPTNCDLLSCGRLDLSPAGAVFVQSSQVICPPA